MQRSLLLIFIFLSIPLSGFSIDIYIPSLPAMTDFFNGNIAAIKLTITAYVIGFSLMQLFIGSIIDTLGRRKPFLLALLVYSLATLVIATTHNIYLLICLRFIQGMALGCSSTANRTILTDLYQGKEMYKMINYMTITWALGPIIAPGIGGYLQYYLGWQANFYFLLGYAILCTIGFWLFVPETLTAKRPLRIITLIEDYKLVLFSQEFWLTVVLLSCLYGTMFLFNLVAPFLIENILHHSAIEFGNIGLLMGIAWFSGNLLNRILINFSIKSKVNGCLLIMFITVISMVLISLKWMNIPVIVVPVFIILVCSSFIFPNYVAKTIEQYPKIRATSSGLLMSMMSFGSVSIGYGLSLFSKTQTQLPLALSLFMLILLSYLVFRLRLSKI